LQACKQTFFEVDASSVCFECVSNGNIRRGLDLFCSFVRSGHTTPKNYLLSLVEGAQATFGTDHIITSIAKGEFRYYSGSRSAIPNIFTQLQHVVTGVFPRFGAVFVLQLLASRLREATPAIGRGFVSRVHIHEVLIRLGVPPDRCDEAIARLTESGLLIPNTISPLRPLDAKYFRISAFGNYIVKQMIMDPAYLSCVMLDTPIHDDKVFRTLMKSYPEGGPEPGAEVHLRCLSAFVDELAHFETIEAERLKEYAFVQAADSVANRIRESLQPTRSTSRETPTAGN
jgi:hypothetical protein